MIVKYIYIYFFTVSTITTYSSTTRTSCYRRPNINTSSSNYSKYLNMLIQVPIVSFSLISWLPFMFTGYRNQWCSYRRPSISSCIIPRTRTYNISVSNNSTSSNTPSTYEYSTSVASTCSTFKHSSLNKHTTGKNVINQII